MPLRPPGTAGGGKTGQAVFKRRFKISRMPHRSRNYIPIVLQRRGYGPGQRAGQSTHIPKAAAQTKDIVTQEGAKRIPREHFETRRPKQLRCGVLPWHEYGPGRRKRRFLGMNSRPGLVRVRRPAAIYAIRALKRRQADKALYWYERTAEQGLAGAQYNVV